jgi:hypothetical protein
MQLLIAQAQYAEAAEKINYINAQAGLIITRN